MKSATSIISRADAIWRDLIKKRDPACRICRVAPSTEAHHIAHRGNFAVRFDPLNGLGLCVFCHHQNGHDRPEYFERHIRLVIGDELYDSLMARSRVIVKRNGFFIKERIQEMKGAMVSLVAQP